MNIMHNYEPSDSQINLIDQWNSLTYHLSLIINDTRFHEQVISLFDDMSSIEDKLNNSGVYWSANDSEWQLSPFHNGAA